jgi:hypothetical protein
MRGVRRRTVSQRPEHDMKTSTVITLALTVLFVGCATAPRQSSHGGVTRIAVTGTDGALLTAFYVQDNRRTASTNTVPWSLEVPGLSSLDLRKINPADEVVVDVGYESDTTRSQIKKPLPPGVVGIRVEVRNGLTATPY